ncbi:MAG: hypothetical protein H6672_08590 [Anaerolineaceae bacterium]|nr:hypothetical protein [Anaerolineaceae bacterium]
MGKRRSKKRGYKLINFKAYYDDDADIVTWWEDIEEGERSEALRAVIREYLGLPMKRRQTPVIDLPELLEVRRDTLWIKDALNDMPAYLERLIQHVAANVQPAAVGQMEPRASPIEPALTEAESQRRTRRMKRATW